jgi:hypothetical protein
MGPAARHDIYFRDLASPSQNPDVRAIDHVIDTTVATGHVDPKRIYLAGWSNGAFFASLYAIARGSTPTPGGNVIAGAAVYAGGDPLQNTSATQTPSCAYGAYPTSSAALYVIHRACDAAVPCDAAQQAAFAAPPGYDVEGWVATLRGAVADPNVLDVFLSGIGTEAAGCASTCEAAAGFANHVHWPDGFAGSDVRDWEGEATAANPTPGMLAFVRAHPHP